MACCPIHAHTVEELISGADAALYQAKSSGQLRLRGRSGRSRCNNPSGCTLLRRLPTKSPAQQGACEAPHRSTVIRDKLSKAVDDVESPEQRDTADRPGPYGTRLAVAIQVESSPNARIPGKIIPATGRSGDLPPRADCDILCAEVARRFQPRGDLNRWPQSYHSREPSSWGSTTAIITARDRGRQPVRGAERSANRLSRPRSWASLCRL